MTYRTSKGSSIIKVVSGGSASFIVFAGEMSVLVDSSYVQRRKGLFRSLERLGVEKIDHIVITHAHYDHTGNVSAVVDRYRSTVITHRSNDVLLREAGNSPVKGTNVLVKAYLSMFGWLSTAIMKYPPCAPDLLVDEEMVLNENIRIVHTPGHTEGSVSVIVDNEVALVGDLMFGVFRRSIMPPFGTDVPAIRRSWGRMLETGCTTFLPAHGGGISAKRVKDNLS